MRVKNYQDMPLTMDKAWKWVVAIDAFDHDHPDTLAELLRAEPMPEELRPIIADIVTGNRKPNRRAAAKLKIPAAERMQIAGTLSVVLGLIDEIRYKAIHPSDLEGEKGVAMYSLHGVQGKYNEPVEISRELEMEAHQLIQDTASDLGVHPETIENLLRDFRRKIENYPNI